MSQQFEAFEEPEEQREAQTPIDPPKDRESWGSKWKAASKRWARETNLSYLSNPATRKDFRVQFRGNRSLWLFGTFLLALGSISVYEYWQVTSQNLSIGEAQERLLEFYAVVMITLGVVVGLVAPAFAAGAIVAEKQRKSLDLVFSAPVRPRVYLVGKLMASFRYTWILMALSLPFTAMSVMLGGASWIDIVSAYVLLSMQGLVFTSIALLFSALGEKTMNALIYTYGTVVAYVLATIGLARLTDPVPWQGPDAGNGKPFFYLLNPITLHEALGTVTKIGPVPVPNILLAAATMLVVVRLCLAVAGGALVRPSRIEAAKLRFGAACGFAAFVGVVTYMIQNQNPDFGPLELLPVVGSSVLLVFMPFLSCYGFDGDQKSKPSGMFSVRRMLSQSPAGALPYVLFTLGLAGMANWLGIVLGGGHIHLAYFAGLAAYAAGFWTFFWACGRYASSYLLGLRASRTVQFILFTATVGGPIPFLMLYASTHPGIELFGPASAITKLYILAPLFTQPILDNAGQLLAWGVVLAFFGWLLAWWSEGNLRRRLAKKGKDLSEISRATGMMPG